MRKVWGIIVFCLLILGVTRVHGEEVTKEETIKLQTSGSGWYTEIDEFRITSYDIELEGLLLNAVFKEYGEEHRDEDGVSVTLIDNDRDIEIGWRNHIIHCDNNTLVYSKIKEALRDKYMVNIVSEVKIDAGHFIEVCLNPDQKKDFVVPIYIPSLRVKGDFKVTTYDKYGGKESKWIKCDGEALFPIDRKATASFVYGDVFFKGSEEYKRLKAESE